jgi:hypothetical protein
MIQLNPIETFGGNWELMEISVPFNVFFFSPLKQVWKHLPTPVGSCQHRFAEFGTNKS